MATNSDREIDWEIARLSGGLSAARRSTPTQQGSLRASDWNLEEPGEDGPLSERGKKLEQDLAAIEAEAKRPIVESIAPMSMESAVVATSDAAPPHPVAAVRKRPSRAHHPVWTGAAAAMSVLALGLVVELGLSPVPTRRAPTPAAAVPAAPAPMGAVNEAAVNEAVDVAFTARPMVMLDPVLISAEPPAAAPSPAAQVSTTPAARMSRYAMAPSPAAISPQKAIPSLAALAPTASAEISRPAAAVAISMAGRRAASCVSPDDARATMPVSVTFAPSGRVTTATVDGGPFAGTAVGGCIARALRGASVGPFEGAPVTVHSSVRIR
jgi:hypothetical protein